MCSRSPATVDELVYIAGGKDSAVALTQPGQVGRPRVQVLCDRPVAPSLGSMARGTISLEFQLSDALLDELRLRANVSPAERQCQQTGTDRNARRPAMRAAEEPPPSSSSIHHLLPICYHRRRSFIPQSSSIGNSVEPSRVSHRGPLLRPCNIALPRVNSEQGEISGEVPNARGGATLLK